MKKKEKLLTIGQFAAMHGINKKTLMWYDEIGLFKPAAIHPENRYRGYSYHQSPILETILLLRELGVSINEIQDFMGDRSAGRLKSLLEEKIAGLDLQVSRLQAARTLLCAHLGHMETLLGMDLSEISIIEKEERCLATVEIGQDTTFEQKVELVAAEAGKYQLGRFHHASYGSMIPVASLQDGSFGAYSKLFIEIPFLAYQDGLHRAPGGRYLRAFHQGDWEGLPGKYQEILGYAREHSLELFGFSYEMGINEDVIDRMEDYITQIEIPILG
ncbi:MAG: MerR family transcriptional regulator [Lachnospiraceae bacterium]|jgi:DNA-binding transcriptional MerR regulator|nr:MerR family transcriptional regulator [Lachnospiraceae bacterium]